MTNMIFRTVPLRIASALCLVFLFVSISLVPSRVSAAHSAGALDSDYVLALAAADHFLQAWQAGDAENGLVLLTNRAKEAVGADNLEKFFANSKASGYEITRGRLLKQGRYEFPVVLVSGSSTKAHVRRRFSSVVVVNTGNNDWAVDKLP
jgi:hypothetical protein